MPALADPAAARVLGHVRVPDRGPVLPLALSLERVRGDRRHLSFVFRHLSSSFYFSVPYLYFYFSTDCSSDFIHEISSKSAQDSIKIAFLDFIIFELCSRKMRKKKLTQNI